MVRQGMGSRADIFTELRPVLLKLARRILRNNAEAEDIIQEAWLRWAQAGEVLLPRSFLATIVTRLCLNHLALARVRLNENAPVLLDKLSSQRLGPAEHVEFADSITEAFSIVLGNLSPVERAVFLLREAFEFDYGDIASVVDRSEENCRQILKRARNRITTRDSTAPPDREQSRHFVCEFLNAAETGKLDPLLKLLSAEAALAPAQPDLSKPVPPLIYDREIFLQTLRDALAQMRNVSEDFVIFPIGPDYACVARSGTTAKRAIFLRVSEEKIAGVRLIICPALLHELQILMPV